MSVTCSRASCPAVRAWRATRATARATAASGESSTRRMASVSRGRGTVALTGVRGMWRVGLAKMSLRDLRTLNRDRSPYSARLRRAPLAGSAARTCSEVISARERWPASAQAVKIGVIPMMWMRAVWGSRERWRGARPLPLSMTSSRFTDSGRGVFEAEGFAAWYETVEPRLRIALSAAYGPERGREAAAEALAWAWAWEHLDRLEEISHPVPYLFRVGRSRTRVRRPRLIRPGTSTWSEPWVEPGLARALATLTQRQRVAVMLICGHEWTLAEVAEYLGVKVTTVQTHMDRGLAKLRASLEVSPDE